jgi:hypothetical protein
MHPRKCQQVTASDLSKTFLQRRKKPLLRTEEEGLQQYGGRWREYCKSKKQTISSASSEPESFRNPNVAIRSFNYDQRFKGLHIQEVGTAYPQFRPPGNIQSISAPPDEFTMGVGPVSPVIANVEQFKKMERSLPGRAGIPDTADLQQLRIFEAQPYLSFFRLKREDKRNAQDKNGTKNHAVSMERNRNSGQHHRRKDSRQRAPYNRADAHCGQKNPEQGMKID